jgi:hypothetical protein
VRYLKFHICNFKGIKDAEIDLRTRTGANVFSLVGLNESGKTTILEAIYSFSPDHIASNMRTVATKTEEDAAKERLPRQLLARFSGEIIVEATVALSTQDKQLVVHFLKTEYELIVDPKVIPSEIVLRRSDKFERGDYLKTSKTLDFEPRGKKVRQRKDKPLSGEDLDAVYHAIWAYTPDIAYYDSFIFDFPSRIYLTPRAGFPKNWVYRRMFEDVLATGRVPYALGDVTRRLRNERYIKSWFEFFTDWSANDDKDRVQQIVDQASETITSTVFGKWNKIFKEEVRDKEIVVQYGVEQGRKLDKEKKSYVNSDEHDIYITLEVKHGVRRFPIQDRSLGFRWFFAFLLFTQFRTKKWSVRPVLFLFDEPAANLHSAAQERLIESFPGIATGDNMLLYSTHSHYMISPDWLEQTFIVTNDADSPNTSVMESAVVDDDSLNIKAQLYRSFANEHPSETSYFQPIMDRLEVGPSLFDISLPSIVMEGKSDFYILRYAQMLMGSNALRLLPGTGAGTFGALIALGAAWGTKFVFLLDADNAGLKERGRYALEHGARVEALCTLSDFDPTAKRIEDMVDEEARGIIGKNLDNSSVGKKEIRRFFQEQLAKREMLPLGPKFEASSRKILEGLAAKLDEVGA